MAFEQETFSRATFKRILGKSHTSNDRDPANEPFSSDFVIAAQNVWAESISPTPATAITDGVSSALLTLELEEVSGTDNAGTYSAYRTKLSGAVPASLSGKVNRKTGLAYASGDYVGDIIPKKIGDGFQSRLFAGAVETPPLDASDWFVDCSAGVVVQEDDVPGNMIDYSTTGTLQCYVYIGAFLPDAITVGGGSWIDPVLFRVVQQSASAPGSPAEGDAYVNTSDNHIYMYVSSSWVDQGAPVATDRIIDLSTTGEHVYQFSTTWDDQGIPNDNDAVIVNNDGEDKPAMYLYDDSIGDGEWTKIADADLLSVGNDMNDSYHQGDPGIGRTITVDEGPVDLDATSGDYAPLELSPQTSNPSTDVAAGQMCVRNDMLCIYDGSRSKWLSVQRQWFFFGKKGLSKKIYLSYGGGNIPSNNSGLRLGKNATIVGITGQLDQSGTCDFRIRKNDAVADILSLNLATAVGGADMSSSINVDVDTTDYLQCYLDNTSNVEDPVVMIEIAYRP